MRLGEKTYRREGSVTILFPLAVLICVASIVVGLLIPSLRPMAVSGAASLLFLVCLFGWSILLSSGIVPGPPAGPLGALAFLLPPLLPAAIFLYLMSRKGGTT